MRADDWRRFSGMVVDGRYRLQRLLGCGSFGGVFEAEEEVAGRFVARVAVKLIEPQSADFAAEIAEMSALRGLNHPHLARGLAVGQCSLEGRALLFVVMDLAEDTLLTRLRRSLLTPAEAVELAAHVGDGLSYLHANRVVHRDLKPANLLRAGELWQIADFGLVRTLKEDGSAMLTKSEPSGTFPYMPPDAFRGEISPGWDVWSLGVLLVEALTGKRPFQDATLAEYVYAVLHQEPDFPGDLPEPLPAIIRGCLARERDSRWTADQVRAAALAFLAPSADTVRPRPAPLPLSPEATVLSISSPALAAPSPPPPPQLSPLPVEGPMPVPDRPEEAAAAPKRRASAAQVAAAVAAAIVLLPATLYGAFWAFGRSSAVAVPPPAASPAAARPASAVRGAPLPKAQPAARPAAERRAVAAAAAVPPPQPKPAPRRTPAPEQEADARVERERERSRRRRDEAREERERERRQDREQQERRPRPAAKPRAKPPAAAAKPARARFCPHCGETLAPGQRFCSKNGRAI